MFNPVPKDRDSFVNGDRVVKSKRFSDNYGNFLGK